MYKRDGGTSAYLDAEDGEEEHGEGEEEHDFEQQAERVEQRHHNTADAGDQRERAEQPEHAERPQARERHRRAAERELDDYRDQPASVRM